MSTPSTHRARSLRRTTFASLLAMGMLAVVPTSVSASGGQDAPTLEQVLARRRAAQVAPDAGQVIETRVTAESRSGVRRLRIGDFQYLSDSDRSYAGYDLGAGSWDTFAAVVASALADEFATQAARRKLAVRSIDVVLTSRPDTPEVARTRRVSYPRNLAWTAYIDTDASPAAVEALCGDVERASPVLAAIRDPQAIGHGPVALTASAVQPAADAPPGLRDFLVEKRQAIARLAEAAAAGTAPPPVGLRAHARVEPLSGLRSTRTGKGNYHILHDSRTDRGGSGLAPTVEEHLVGVLATCMTHIFEIEAAKRGIVLDGLELRTRAVLPPRGDGAGAARFSDIAYDVRIASPEPAARIDGLRDAVEGSCPIYNLLHDPQPVAGQVVRGRFDASIRPAGA